MSKLAEQRRSHLFIQRQDHFLPSSGTFHTELKQLATTWRNWFLQQHTHNNTGGKTTHVEAFTIVESKHVRTAGEAELTLVATLLASPILCVLIGHSSSPRTGQPSGGSRRQTQNEKIKS